MSISSELERIMAGKSELASAIEEKGVDVPEGTKINEMPALVRSITGGGGGNADWNAAEGEPGHVLNRTHYVEAGQPITVFPETTATDFGDQLYFTAPYEYYPNAGDICEIVYNGVTYNCPATPMDASFAAPGAAFMFAGNLSTVDMGEDTGEPFCIQIFNDAAVSVAGGLYGILSVLDGSATVTVSVGVRTERIHKLDMKFLPDGLPYVESDLRPVFSELTAETDGSEIMFVEPWSVYPKAGDTIVVVYNGVTYNCPATPMDFSYAVPGGEMMLAGKLSAMEAGEDNGEPFCLSILNEAVQSLMGGASAVLMPMDGSTTVTVSVSVVGETIHKLDTKYLPDGYPYEYDAVENMFTDMSLLASELEEENWSNELRWSISSDAEPGICFPQEENSLIVYWNQQKYEFDAGMFGNNYAIYGNLSLYFGEVSEFSPDTGEPFCLYFADLESYGCSLIVFPKNTEEDVVLTVALKRKAIKQMDERFIPDMSQLILKSPNGTRYQITVNDTGALTATALA